MGSDNLAEVVLKLNSENIVIPTVILHLTMLLFSYLKTRYFEIVNFSFLLFVAVFFTIPLKCSEKFKIMSWVTSTTVNFRDVFLTKCTYPTFRCIHYFFFLFSFSIKPNARSQGKKLCPGSGNRWTITLIFLWVILINVCKNCTKTQFLFCANQLSEYRYYNSRIVNGRNVFM